MHGPLIKASLSYYVTIAICSVVNQFDYLNKKNLVYIVGTVDSPKNYVFLWCYRKDHPTSYGYLFAGSTPLVRFLNYYVSPWLRVKNE